MELIIVKDKINSYTNDFDNFNEQFKKYAQL